MASTVRAVALDVDGTLAGSDHRVSAATRRVLAQLTTHGVTPIIVTGRTEHAALVISDDSGLTAPVISCNGAMVTDPTTRERLFVSVIDPETVGRIVAFAASRGLDCILWNLSGMAAEKASRGAALLAQINEETVDIAPLERIMSEQVVKVMLSGDPAVLDGAQDDVAAELPLLNRGMDQFFETSTPGATKKEALRFVLGRLGILAHECIGIADGDTDAGWLGEVGLPVAVSNAMQSVQEVALLHIGNHADDAVARFLASFFQLDGCPDPPAT